MKQATRLYSFEISHYCEKARWALDWHEVPYQEIFWAPGVHRFLTRRLGARGSSLPILVAAETVLQDSGKIIDWAEQRPGPEAGLLSPQRDPEEARAIERRGDEVIGPAVRRLIYGEMLPKYHRRLQPAFFASTSLLHLLAGRLMWPATIRFIQKGYNATSETVSETRAQMEVELDWLDALLADGRCFLVGDRFSRVDMTLASLLAPFARPPRAPVYHQMSLSPSLLADVERWRNRPVMEWVNEVYRDQR